VKVVEGARLYLIDIYYSFRRLWAIIKPNRIRWMPLHQDIKQPLKAYEADAAWDIEAVEDLILPPGSHTNIGCGIAIEVKKGWSYDIRGRSGMNKVGLIAALGLADSHYVGEIRVVLSNFSGAEIVITKGQRVGQIKVNPVWDMQWQQVSEFNVKPGTRGAKGWGSSGGTPGMN